MPRPRKKFNRPQRPKGPKRNEQINAPKVRLIDENGKNLGVIDIAEALKYARDKELDLLEISANANPPVTRIADYGKYMYDQEKKVRGGQSRRNAAGIMKGVRISMRTGKHDLEIKAQNVDKFLKKGYKVRVELFMRGREKSLSEIADKKIKEFLETLTEEYEIVQEPTKYPRGLHFTLKKG